MIGEFQKTGAPDYTEPIIGFRTWKLQGYELYPAYLGRKRAWSPGVNVAACEKNATLACAAAPQTECSCGLYAWFSFDDYMPPLRVSRKRRAYSLQQKEMVRSRYAHGMSFDQKQQLAQDAGIGDVQRLLGLATRLHQTYPETPPLVRGAVVMWGRIELHQTGMRGEYGKVVALARGEAGQPAGGLDAAARYYRVPLVEEEHLAATALDRGQLWVP